MFPEKKILFKVSASPIVHVAEILFDLEVVVTVVGPSYHFVVDDETVLTATGTTCGSTVDIVSSERQNSLNSAAVRAILDVGFPVAIARGDSLHFLNVSDGISNTTLCS